MSKLNAYKDEIISQYLANESASSIAKKFNTTAHTVIALLKKYNIKTRNKKEASKIRTNILLLQDQEQGIIHKYNKKQSILSLSNEYNVSRTVIKRILLANHTALRTVSENSQIQFANYSIISPACLEYVNGWLLGDGSLSNYQCVQAHFKQPSKHEEYIDYIKNIFNKENIYCNKYQTYDYNTCKYYHRLTTCSTKQFRELKNKWYPDGTKIVPKDISLTPNLIKMWIFDDGTTCKRDKTLTFCTHGFNYKDCIFLKNNLNKFLNIKCASIIRDGKYFKIRLSNKGASSLFNIIGECDLECFKYKWNNIMTK